MDDPQGFAIQALDSQTLIQLWVAERLEKEEAGIMPHGSRSERRRVCSSTCTK
jgi:hypothetical protein